MTPPGLVVTFYSYKGGVGRTFLLANAAVWLARAGFRVLCIDWDLEAPGLFHYFEQRGLLPRAPRTGLVDLLASIQAGELVEWSKLVQNVRLEESGGGRLDLLDAGDSSSDDYGRALGALSLRTAYSDPKVALGQKLEELRAQWTRDYDLVFVDSRTGLTDAGGICTAQLPDLVVAVFAPNVQGFDGALSALAKARAQRALLPTVRGDFLSLPVLSRFDPQATGDGPEKWQRIAAGRLAELYEPWLDAEVRPEQIATLLRLPYSPRWSFGEPLAVLEENSDDPTTVSYAVATIAAFCVRRFANNSDLVADRGRYVREVSEQGPAVLGRRKGASPHKYRYDVFLSYASPQRERALAIAGELGARGRSVFIDQQELVPGTAWADGLANALRNARGVVALVDDKPGIWQRAEVEAFLPVVRDSKERFVIPVWLAPMPAWPELFDALHGLDGKDRSPPQIASAIHEAIQRRDKAGAPVQGGPTEEGLASDPEWSEEAALAAYRGWLAKEHNRLVPYFDGASAMLLEDVYVEVDLEASSPADRQSTLFDKRESSKPRGRGGLRDLLLSPKPAAEASKPSLPAPRWIIEGEPGAGKTTLARSLAHDLAIRREQIPVFVPMARLGKATFHPVAFAVADMLGEEGGSSPRGRVLQQVLRAAVARGELVVLLDGLDEVNPEQLELRWRDVERFAADPANRRIPIAVLTRPIAVERRELPPDFRRARVVALRPDQQKALLAKLLGDTEGHRVMSHLSPRPRLAELASSPLLLTLMAVVARDTVLATTELPATRARLYATAVDLLLRRGFGVLAHGVRDQEPARRVLQLLAYRQHDQGGEAWPRRVLSDDLTALRRADDEVNWLVKETWGTNDAFLDDIGSNSGILGPHDGPNLPWRYLHRSLREFLAAEAIAAWPPERRNQHLAAWLMAEETEARAEREKKHSSTQQPLAAGPSASRWGEVYALLCGLADEVGRSRVDPLTLLKTIRGGSPEIARRTLRQVEWLPAEAGLGFALEDQDVDGDLLLDVCRAWLVPAEVAERLLMADVNPETPIDRLGGIWYALESMGRRPSRTGFFAKCDRGVTDAPRLRAVTVPAGRFTMGSPVFEDERDDDETQHAVSVPEFWLCTTVVTNADFARLERSRELGQRKRKKLGDLSGHPAVNVTWWGAYLFCRWLGDDVRLPSEAEWEYACRAGTTTPFSFGPNITPTQVNYDGNYPFGYGVKGENRGRTVPVGSLPANPWGLHEMHGNVWEWCEDWYCHYEIAPVDGSAQQESHGSGRRVLRGGSWIYLAKHCRSAYRDEGRPGSPYGDVGFRPASSSPGSFTTSLPQPSDRSRSNQSEQSPPPPKRTARASKKKP